MIPKEDMDFELMTHPKDALILVHVENRLALRGRKGGSERACVSLVSELKLVQTLLCARVRMRVCRVRVHACVRACVCCVVCM